MSNIYSGVIKNGVQIKDIYEYNNLYAFIFTFMYNLFDDQQIDMPAWMQTQADSILLDMQYCMIHSGDKKLSKTFYSIFKANEDDDVFWQRWVFMIYFKFKDKWEKEYAALTAEYDPLENYNSTEKITRTGDDTVSSKVELDAIGYDKAFNSSDFEAASKSHTEADDTKNFNKTTFNSAVDTSKHGNIGVTTSQQMLESEIELRNKWNFYEIMFNDIDSLITTNLY